MKKAENEKESKSENNIQKDDMTLLKDFENIINNNKLNTISAHDLNQFFRVLTHPRFLGSYHMKKAILNKNKNINNLLKGNLELKYTKSLRNIVFNPLTITLIILAILFNFFWIFYSLQ